MKQITIYDIKEWNLFKELAKGIKFDDPKDFHFPITINCEVTFADKMGF
jgi:hypothetical protein